MYVRACTSLLAHSPPLPGTPQGQRAPRQGKKYSDKKKGENETSDAAASAGDSASADAPQHTDVSTAAETKPEPTPGTAAAVCWCCVNVSSSAYCAAAERTGAECSRQDRSTFSRLTTTAPDHHKISVWSEYKDASPK